jgi:hypothetical protein
MGTRSFISIKHKDNTYSGVYCHWDGYPEWNGNILKKDYQARSKVIDLIDGGANADDIYRFEVGADCEEIINSLEPYAGTAYDKDGKKVDEFYDY